MKWTSYDSFGAKERWPGDKWVRADLGSGELWDSTATTAHSTEANLGFTISIPRFTLFRPPSHAKALMLSKRAFEIEANCEFGSRCEMAVEIFGTDPNPFGVEPGDPRLASGAMVTLDLATGIVLDFLVTNDRVFAVYERLPYAQTTLGRYPAFTELIPTSVKTEPMQWHSFRISYNRATDSAEWWVDGEQVAHQTPVGAPRGLTSPIVKLNNLRIGGALFTLMDGGVSREADWRWVTKPLNSILKSATDELFGQGGRVAFRNYETGYRPPQKGST
jgi:hypothetical protein